MGGLRVRVGLGVVMSLCALAGCGTVRPGQRPDAQPIRPAPVAARTPRPVPRLAPVGPREPVSCLTWAALSAAAMDEKQQRTYLADAPAEQAAIGTIKAQAPDGTSFMVSRVTSRQVRLYMAIFVGNPERIVQPFTGLVMSYHPPLRRFEPDNSPPGYYSLTREVYALDGHGRQVQDYYVVTGGRGGLCAITSTVAPSRRWAPYPLIIRDRHS